MSGDRATRLGDSLGQSLSLIMQSRLCDPHIGMPNITAVQLSRDLSSARVFVTFVGTADAEVSSRVARLNRAAGFLRRELAHQADLPVVPRLRFLFDDCSVRGPQMEALIDSAMARDARSAERRQR